ncbi:MAG: hypothetical protein P3W93_009135 [Thermus sp.]|nr:hypothetical protein [Thermus sp.]
MKPFLLGLVFGGLLGASAAWVSGVGGSFKGIPPSSAAGPVRVQFPPQVGEGCEPQVYLFLNGEFFRMLPVPGGEPKELFPVEPVPNPFGGS